ncbi:MAG TPA: hypothetical protein VHG72_12435 [Polyangia bacterium]|nr:hypothetical protein [Polyangia bacterium]
MTKRVTPFLGTVAALALAFAAQGCGGNNSPATNTGGTTGTATGGTTGTGTGGTTTTTGTGGTTGGGTGGASPTGAAGSSGTFGSPACGNNMAGTAIAKGIACTAADATVGSATALCYKTCGPAKTGAKPETCPAGGGIYAEGACAFDPTADYSCYALPATTPDPTCPTTAIQSGADCTGVAACVVCGGTAATPGVPGYLDSTGAAKQGYCVCQASAATPTWSCASTTAWPCPYGTGC